MRRDEQEPLYYISVAARLVGSHPQTLRMYERVGLIQPGRSERNMRLYSDTDIERLHQIKRLTQELGVNLAGVEIILSLLERLEKIQAEADRLREALESGPKALGPASERSAQRVEVMFKDTGDLP